MRAPSVLIIASPYEGELMARALGDTGLRILRADAGEGALAMLATELPIAIVLGTALLGADPAPIVAEARSRHQAVPILLLADPDDALAEELRPRVSAIYRRPTDFEALAHEIERIAVDAEGADLYEVEELITLSPTPPPPPPPRPLPRVPTEPAVEPPPLIRAQRTEILSEAGAVSPVASSANGGHAPSTILLRADEALSDMAGLGMDDMVPAPASRAPRPFENRSTIAREIDRELSQAERRLFPDQTPTPLPFVDELDDAHSDIDLDSLAIDTIPGLVQSLGIDELQPAPRARPASPPAAAPSQVRPVQEEGSLAELDVAELIARLHNNAFSGALRVHRPEGDKVVYLDQGEVVGGRSTLRHDHLAELLFREGKLTRDQARARESEARNGQGPHAEGAARPVALRLVELGLLKERELFGVVRRHAEELLYSLFGLESGTYTLGPEVPAADDRLRLPTPMWALVHEGVRRKYGIERLLARLGGREVVVRPTTLFQEVVEAAGLSADERRVVALLDGSRTLAEVRQALGPRTRESMILALVWTLVVCGAVERGGEGAIDDVRHASTVVTAGEGGERRTRPRVASAAQKEAEEAVEKERIATKSAQIVDADYYTVLGLGVEASEHELRRAHARLRADFDPERFSEPIVAAHGEALAEIRQVLDEALRVLLSPGVREAYTANLEPSTDGDA